MAEREQLIAKLRRKQVLIEQLDGARKSMRSSQHALKGGFDLKGMLSSKLLPSNLIPSKLLKSRNGIFMASAAATLGLLLTFRGQRTKAKKSEKNSLKAKVTDLVFDFLGKQIKKAIVEQAKLALIRRFQNRKLP